MRDQEVRSALLKIEDMVRSQSFDEWRRRFVQQHVNSFTFDDENKLLYTEIHQMYEEQVEKRISAELPSDFDMADFMKSLPDFIERIGKSDEDTGKAITTLIEVGDFIQFREMMMISKREAEENAKKSSADQLHGVDTADAVAGSVQGIALDVGNMMKKCAELSIANDDDGWINLLTNDWMRIDKKPIEENKRKSKSEMYMRGIWTMNLSFVECCDMMFTFDKRRGEWDPNLAKVSFPFGGSSTDDDLIASATIDMGFLINLAMFGTSGPGMYIYLIVG